MAWLFIYVAMKFLLKKIFPFVIFLEKLWIHKKTAQLLFGYVNYKCISK